MSANHPASDWQGVTLHKTTSTLTWWGCSNTIVSKNTSFPIMIIGAKPASLVEKIRNKVDRFLKKATSCWDEYHWLSFCSNSGGYILRRCSNSQLIHLLLFFLVEILPTNKFKTWLIICGAKANILKFTPTHYETLKKWEYQMIWSGKIVERRVWYNGESVLYAYQWGTMAHDSSLLKVIPIWTHLHNGPLDLCLLKCWCSWSPKETYEYNINLVSLVFSHVKAEMDLTKPLPKKTHLIRQADYLWVPHTSSNWKELGHISRNCLMFLNEPEDHILDPTTSNEKSVEVQCLSSVLPYIIQVSLFIVLGCYGHACWEWRTYLYYINLNALSSVSLKQSLLSKIWILFLITSR